MIPSLALPFLLALAFIALYAVLYALQSWRERPSSLERTRRRLRAMALKAGQRRFP